VLSDTQTPSTLQYTPTETLDPSVNLLHLELLHHFVSETYTTFSDDFEIQDTWKKVVVRLAFVHPYLMYEILALAALHLARRRPNLSANYYTESTRLQTKALKSFNSVARDVDASNCAPLLIFSSLLGVHVLADPPRAVKLNSHQHLDHIIRSIMLMRNVGKLIIRDWYSHLKESELRPIFSVETPSKPYQMPEPCRDLRKLTENLQMDAHMKHAYSRAIDSLHWTYTASQTPYEKHTTVRWLLGWPIQLETTFQDHLDQRRPEALIILAYYAVVLVFYEECWVVGDSGPCLIRAISSHLGPHWSRWMQWPASFL
jgi:hypothetical protein